MGLWNLLGNFFKQDGELLDVDASNKRLIIETAYKRLYIDSAIDLIARSLNGCEFQTYREGKLIKSLNHYQLNVAPNKNENAFEFWHKVVHNLVYHNEVLILCKNGQLWVADSFFRDTTQGFREYTYKNVVVNTEMLPRTYREQDVLYLKFATESINEVIDNLYSSYGQLLSKAIQNYKKNGQRRYLFKGRFISSITDKKSKEASDLFEKQMSDFMDPEKDGAVLFQPENVQMEDKSPETKQIDTRDIKAISKDMLEFVATGFHIPPPILSGMNDGGIVSSASNPTGDLDNFILFALRPLGELIVTEYNRKMFAREQYIAKTYTKFNMDNFKLLDINKLSTAVDKLFAVGGLCINDVLVRLGQEPIEEDWANKRYVTKNYERADLDSKGSETNNDGTNEHGEDTAKVSHDGGQEE
ncbi:phage portal protein [Bacillus mycoides]|uniref:phage portal protein n=1 Tax=Bacillus mycoides TaxID=1405 RepID=UPI003CFC9809